MHRDRTACFVGLSASAGWRLGLFLYAPTCYIGAVTAWRRVWRGWGPRERVRHRGPGHFSGIELPHPSPAGSALSVIPPHPRRALTQEFLMQDIVKEMKLQDLKVKTPTELLSFAEETGVENASAMRKQELMFAILKQLAAKETEIIGTGVMEVLQDGFGFLRSPDANYLPGPDDIYVSPSQIRRFALRSGDTVEGQIRSPKEGE